MARRRTSRKRSSGRSRKSGGLISKFFKWLGKQIRKLGRLLTGKKKRKSDVRKIYKTTDGYFTDNAISKKPRRVAVIDQRKDDGALAVVKIYSKKGKQGNAYLDAPVLSPSKHISLTEDSIVGSQIHVAKKGKDGVYKPIFKGDMQDTSDELTKKEHRAIKKNAGGAVKKHRDTTKKKLKRWKKHFK